MTQSAENPEVLVESMGVRFSPKGVAHIEGGQRLWFVPKEKIRQITLRQGFQAERPLVQTLFSAALILTGLYPLPHLILWLFAGGKAYDIEFMLLLLIPLGAWFLNDGLKKGLYFELTLVDEGRRKIPLQRPLKFVMVKWIITQAEALGYVINRGGEG